MTQAVRRWVCCQIGRREHYAVPRALHRRGRLAELVTDFWAGGVLSATPGSKMGQRFHDDLRNAAVWAPSAQSLMVEASLKVTGRNGWDATIRRNAWFQDVAAERLHDLASRADVGASACFAYSYAAGRVFEAARAHGWTTVLGQIDPGPVEERLVSALHERHPHFEPRWRPAPQSYWDSWRRECELADRIIVNSAWSRDALCAEGVAAEKIRIIPLAYERLSTALPAPVVDQKRSQTLRVLFLGQVTMRKGVVELIDAAELLRSHPVQFIIAGPILMSLPAAALRHPRITWAGSVPGSDIAKWFARADVFILPTHSDGFGLTQLEALAHQVPVITTARCGRVVEDGINGIILPEVSGEAIAAAVRQLLDDPGLLPEMRRRCEVSPAFSLSAVSAALEDAVA